MTVPRVTEVQRALEPVSRDPFLNNLGLPDASKPESSPGRGVDHGKENE